MGLFNKNIKTDGTESKLKVKKKENLEISNKKKKIKKKSSLSSKAQKAIKYVQDTIPYESVFDDGIFVNKYGEYSKVYPIMDVNFKIESPDVQAQIYLDYQTCLTLFHLMCISN